MKINWDNLFFGLLFGVCTLLVITFFTYIFESKVIMGYSLTESSGKLSIEKDVDWDVNDIIPLDRNITIEEAIKLVDSLNHNLKH